MEVLMARRKTRRRQSRRVGRRYGPSESPCQNGAARPPALITTRIIPIDAYWGARYAPVARLFGKSGN